MKANCQFLPSLLWASVSLPFYYCMSIGSMCIRVCVCVRGSQHEAPPFICVTFLCLSQLQLPLSLGSLGQHPPGCATSETQHCYQFSLSGFQPVWLLFPSVWKDWAFSLILELSRSSTVWPEDKPSQRAMAGAKERARASGSLNHNGEGGKRKAMQIKALCFCRTWS